LIGQNPQAQSMLGALQAHIAEHVAFEYRKQIEEQLGVPYPPPNAEMDEDTEVQISRLAAMAAQQLLQKNQAEAQQQQIQQQMQDPLIQMQQKEMELRERDLALREKKVMTDAADKADRLELEEERINSQERIAGMQVGAKIATDRANLEAKQKQEAMKLVLDAAREADQIQSTQSSPQPTGE